MGLHYAHMFSGYCWLMYIRSTYYFRQHVGTLPCARCASCARLFVLNVPRSCSCAVQAECGAGRRKTYQEPPPYPNEQPLQIYPPVGERTRLGVPVQGRKVSVTYSELAWLVATSSLLHQMSSAAVRDNA